MLPTFAPRAEKVIPAGPETGILAAGWSSTWNFLGPTAFFNGFYDGRHNDVERSVWFYLYPTFDGAYMPANEYDAPTAVYVEGLQVFDQSKGDRVPISAEEVDAPAYGGFNLTMWRHVTYRDGKVVEAKKTYQNSCGYFTVRELVGILAEHERR